MSGMIFFDELDFDNNGQVCATEKTTLANARANYLYLLCIYNARILKSENIALPVFFSDANNETGSMNDVLSLVRAGKDYEKCKATILKNCHKKVQKCCNGTEKESFLKLNEMIDFPVSALKQQKETKKRIENSKFDLEKSYYLTQMYSSIFGEIISAKEANETKTMFKKIINLNRIALEAQKFVSNVNVQPSQNVAPMARA